MTRIKDCNGVVHFRHVCNTELCLCGKPSGDVFLDLLKPEEFKPYPETTERVTCPACARTVCAIRNEPYNALDEAVESDTMMRGIYDAVKPDGPIKEDQQ